MTPDFDSHRLKRLAAENIVRRTWVEHTNTRFRRTAAIVTSARSFRDATTLGRRYRYLSKRPQYYSCSVFTGKKKPPSYTGESVANSNAVQEIDTLLGVGRQSRF